MRRWILFLVVMWMVAGAGLAQQQEPAAAASAQPAAAPYEAMITVKDGRVEVVAELPLDPQEAERLGVSPQRFATALSVLRQIGGFDDVDAAGDKCDPQTVTNKLGLPFPVDPTCPGTPERCIDTFCVGLTGAQRAQCIVTCQKTPVCGECKCSCSPNCKRSCTQRCCRTVEGPPFRQICCTRSCFDFPDEIDPGP